LSLCQICFASPDRFVRNLAFRNIHDRADYFSVACRVRKATCKIMKMLDRTVGHQQPMLIIKVASALRGALKGVFDKIYIVRMSSL
jgi:hypothetical protein